MKFFVVEKQRCDKPILFYYGSSLDDLKSDLEDASEGFNYNPKVLDIYCFSTEKEEDQIIYDLIAYEDSNLNNELMDIIDDYYISDDYEFYHGFISYDRLSKYTDDTINNLIEDIKDWMMI